MLIETCELKQNPARVIARVLSTGEPATITANGNPTGVRLVADRQAPARWVSGARLNSMPPAGRAASEHLVADLAAAHADDDGVSCPWDR